MQRRLLHIGCGSKTKADIHQHFHGDGWLEHRLDIDPQVKPDIVSDICNMSSVADSSYHAVYSSHNIEHVYHHEVPLLFKEVLRVLKPGGFFLIRVPDIGRAAEKMISDGLFAQCYVSNGGTVITPFDILYGGRALVAEGKNYMAHKGGFTMQSLFDTCLQNGFGHASVQRGAWELHGLAIKARVPKHFEIKEKIYKTLPDWLDGLSAK